MTDAEIAEELLVVEAIHRGLADVEAGRMIPHEEVERRLAFHIKQWTLKSDPQANEAE